MPVQGFSRVLSKAKSNGKRFLAGTRIDNKRSLGWRRARPNAREPRQKRETRPNKSRLGRSLALPVGRGSCRPLFLDNLGRPALRGALALVFVQDLFAQPQVLWRRFQIFVGADVFEGAFE